MPQGAAAGSITSLKSKLLQGLATRDQELILGAGKVQQFAAGSIITTQGDSADRLYVLVSGCVRFFYTLPDGRKFLLLLVAPGESFGGAAILPGRNAYLVSSAAVTASRVVSWDQSKLRGFSERFPQILHNALTIAGEYITWYMHAHVAHSTQTGRERLAGVLLDLARAIGVQTPGGIEIEVTNENLADAANLNPYTTSRLMSQWRKSSTIVKGRGTVVLRVPGRLASLQT